ncbi:2Fe-2S iron-sulfur cluster-binding protein [Streptomyces inhibens]|uniref:2Fe-2S iron-sulfur cluster-binding protein n=1 Tax=Streptomyces inhibens TaxID=2293571 RepID=UPI0037971406
MSNPDHRNPQQPYPDQGWQPLPQGGEYESEATAFVQLPEGFTTGVYGGRTPGYATPGADPLAAPGHGYTPPASFTPHTAAPSVPAAGTDPAATGQWTMPFADPSAGYADPAAGYPAQGDPSAHQGPSAIYQGGAPESARPWGGDQVDWPVAGSAEAGGGGAWSVPAAADDGLEESGEYLVGDDGLTGHTGFTGGHPGHPGHSGHPGHPGLTGTGGAAAYQGGGYQGAGAYDGSGSAADAEEATRTGHWNFTAGLSATSGAQTHATGAQEAPHGGAAADPFGGPMGDPYARESGFPAHGAEPGGELPGDGGLSGGDPYGTGAGGSDDAGAGATGHWSLPADALAQWPPAPEAQPQDDAPQQQAVAGPDGVDAPAGASGWTIPVAEGEQPEESGEFAIGDAAGSASPVAPLEVSSHGQGADGAADVPVDTAEPGVPAERAEPGGAVAHGEPGAPGGSGEPTDLDGPTGTEAPADTADNDSDSVGAPDDAAETTGAAEVAGAEIPADLEPAIDASDAAPGTDAYDEHPAASYVLRVNGIDRPVTDAWIGESLLYVLRERLGLAGAKDGCSQGECGACSVQVDGRLVASCLVPAATTAGSEVRTVEGLAQNGVPSDVQRALAASGAVQCGFCVPGMAMTVHDLLEGNHAPSELETRKALCGNLCRCSGYRGVLDAVDEVVKARAQAAEAAYAQGDHAADDPDGTAPADTARIPHQAGPADPTGHAPHDQDPQTGGSA